jgi:hypothetical protein
MMMWRQGEKCTGKKFLLRVPEIVSISGTIIWEDNRYFNADEKIPTSYYVTPDILISQHIRLHNV